MAAKGPLRRVVDYTTKEVRNNEGRVIARLPREVLECGHVVPIVGDMFGPTNAHRRRCRQCREVGTTR